MSDATRFRRLPLLIGLLGLLALAPLPGAGAAQAAVTVRVMTWNWQNASTPLYQRGWTNVVKNQHPDILGLQEICVSWVRQLMDDLRNEAGVDYQVAYGTWRTDWRCGGGAYGDAILVARSAGTISSKGSFRLPAVPESTDQEERGVAWAMVTVGGRTIPVWNTHIGIQGSQTKQIAALAQATGTPAAGIVLGDFNSTPGDSALRPMWATWAEADPGCTAGGGCVPSHDSGKKFDYLFLRGLTAATTQTLPTEVSDHHAVIATVAI